MRRDITKFNDEVSFAKRALRLKNTAAAEYTHFIDVTLACHYNFLLECDAKKMNIFMVFFFFFKKTKVMS